MEYNITLYKNTGFDITNIPDGPALLETTGTAETVPFVYLKQNADLTRIKIEKTYNSIKNVDYCQIGSMYYFVISIEMLNNNVAVLSLEEDALTSLGGVNAINILDGWCTRKCVTTDELFENVVPEDFTPAKPFRTETYKLSEDFDYDNALTIICSTVDLTDSEYFSNLKSIVFVDTNGGNTVTIPGLPPLADETKIKLTTPDGFTITSEYPTVGLFALKTPVNVGGEVVWQENEIISNSLKILKALGLESVIVGAYKLPVASVIVDLETDERGTTGKILSIKNRDNGDLTFVKTSGLGNLEFLYGTYQAKNKKVYSQFNSVMVNSVVSGDTSIFDMKDMYKENEGDTCLFKATSIVSADGTTYLRPKFFEGDYAGKYNWFTNAVKGGNWLNCPLNFEGASGSAINAANYAITKAQGQDDWDAAVFKYQNRKFDYLTKGLGALNATAETDLSKTGTLGMFANVTQAVNPFVQTDYSAYERALNEERRSAQSKKLAYEVEQNLVAPDIAFAQDVSLQIFYGNTFYAQTLRLSDEDLERFDNYLTAFGYKVSEKLTNEAFHGRTNFNFVEANGVTITSNSENASRARRIAAENQLEGGVRIWHTSPTSEKLYSNPISQ